MKILLTIANYNTAELISHLLFSLFRVIGKVPLSKIDILVVDNNSTDISPQILQKLADAGLIQIILNKQQNYHAHALNQGIGRADKYKLFWAMDSDVVILRKSIINDMLAFIESTGADMIGQCNNRSEPHVSSMVLRMETIKRISARFLHGGSPTRYMVKHFRAVKAKVQCFPFRNHYYLLHVGCGTRHMIQRNNDKSNEWHIEKADTAPWYHADPLAPIIHDDFTQIFRKEVPDITPESVLEACQREGRIELELPDESPGPDPSILSPVARGRTKI